MLATTDAPRHADPDPFSIGIALFSAIAGGAAFLETRRGRVTLEQAQRRAFRAAWFDTRRSLIFFKRALDEFETYMLEDGYAGRAFRMGAVRLVVQPRRKQQMLRLRRQALSTAHHLGDDLDTLSENLGSDDQRAVDAILTRLADIAQLPDSYADLVRLGREAVQLYGDLLANVATREGFEDDYSQRTA